MRRTFIIFSVSVTLLTFYSCRSSRINFSEAVRPPASAIEYIDRWKDVAMSEMKRTGIPASITLAQGMVESGNGQSRLALEGNNHFGIKCHNDWKGATIRHHDDRRNECFRKYRNAEESYRDHSDFIVSAPRYRSLFRLEPADYRGWAHGLKKAGYATNPDYANMLIRKIEEYSLYEYDRLVLSGSPVIGSSKDQMKKIDSETGAFKSSGQGGRGDYSVSPGWSSERVLEYKRLKYIIVKEGDTRESIEKEMKLLKWELPRYNELPDDFIPHPGQLLYLQPKRKKAEVGKEYHIVAEGENMYIISQKYGIKLRQLYYMNRMEEGSEPNPGRKLWLRRLMPVL